MLVKDQRFLEDGELARTRTTADGFLAADVRCARTGIQVYTGAEMDRPDRDFIRVYRPDSEVFAKDSIASYAGKTVTNDHPDELVTAENWKEHTVGNVGNEVLRDGEFVRVSMLLMDQGAITDVDSGKREISMGYLMDLDFTSGTTDSGEEYDAVMRNLRMNHLAIVDRGRAGSQVRIGDKQSITNWGASPVTDDGNSIMKVRNIVVDGLTVETTDQGAQAIEKLQGQVKAAADAADAAKATADSTIAEKDKELATKDAKIKELESKVLEGAALDKLVADRSAVVAKAKAIDSEIVTADKSDLEIKTQAVASAQGAEFAKDKSAAYIEAAFDMLKVAEGTGDSVRDALIAGGQQPATDSADNGQEAYEKRLQDAWKPNTAA